MQTMELSKANLIDEIDERIKRIRRTYNEEQLQAVLKSLDQTLSSLSVVPKPLELKETPPPSRDAYFYLYVQSHNRLSRLNVSKLSESPVFELVCHLEERDCLSRVVCFDKGSEIFMVGDVFIHENRRPEYIEPFFNVFSIDTAKSPSFLPCPSPSKLSGPKVDPLVVTLQGKTYVLALHFYRSQPCFEVFDNGMWKTLPPPPFIPTIKSDYDLVELATPYSFISVYAWDHMIVVCFEKGISYCFDTETVEWMNMQQVYTESSEVAPVLQCVAEYDKFLIAKPYDSEELVVYELDADGFPHFYQKLNEFEVMFAESRVDSSTNAFIIPFEDDADKFCFICSGLATCTNIEKPFEYFVCVAVFRMSISNLQGRKKLTAVLEAYQLYPFYLLASATSQQDIYSAFLKRDNLNLDKLKADRSFGRGMI